MALSWKVQEEVYMSLVSANKVETNTYELVVSIGAEDFKKGIDKIYKKTAKNITVPVFARKSAQKRNRETIRRSCFL